jgi:hypothetical protein
MHEKPLISEELRELLDVPGVGRVLLDSWIARRDAQATRVLETPASPPSEAAPFDRLDARATAQRILEKLGF